MKLFDFFHNLLLYYIITKKKEMANRKRNLLENVFMTEEQKLKVERQARRRADIECELSLMLQKYTKTKRHTLVKITKLHLNNKRHI